jgi:hypothetical protein
MHSRSSRFAFLNDHHHSRRRHAASLLPPPPPAYMRLRVRRRMTTIMSSQLGKHITLFGNESILAAAH